MFSFSRVTSFFLKEREYFSKLSFDERKLLISFFLFSLATPLATTFSATYFWRVTKNPEFPILFSLSFFVCLALGFLSNSFLLKRYKAKYLYIFACMLAGVVPFLFTAFIEVSKFQTMVAGSALGLSMGLYWGNRHFLTSSVTQKEHRFFFLSLITVMGTGASIVAPLAIGWFIVAGEYIGLYSSQTAYIIATAVGLMLFLGAGFILRGLRKEARVVPSSLLPKNASPLWRKLCAMEFFDGMMDGIEAVVPLVLILLFLGMEESVGTIQSLTASIAAMVLYTVGRKPREHREFQLLAIWAGMTIIGGLILFTFFQKEGLIAYFLCVGLVRAFRWTSVESVMYRMIDGHIQDEEERFAYLLNRELVLDLGRSLSLFLLLVFLQWSPIDVLHMSFIYIILLQIPFLILLRMIYVKMSRPLDSSSISR